MYKPGATYDCIFPTHNMAVGISAADELPTAMAYHNGAADATFVITISHLGGGVYRTTGTVPATYALGDRVQILAFVLMDGKTWAETISQWVVDTKHIGDLNDIDGAGLATSAEVADLKKLAGNRHRVDRENSKFYIYEDDGTTVHREFDCTFDEETGELIDLVPVL